MNSLCAQFTYIDDNSKAIKKCLYVFILFSINAYQIPEPLKKMCECQMPLVITNDDT